MDWKIVKSFDECSSMDTYAVILLSNFSINFNFSHFLHAILRLFCALIDARWIVWDEPNKSFVSVIPFTLWVDPYFKMNSMQKSWLRAFLGPEHSVRQLDRKRRAQPVCTTELLYGSGCVRLLPPEKWFGYPGCRAASITPAFGYYMRQKFNASSRPFVVNLPNGNRIHADGGWCSSDRRTGPISTTSNSVCCTSE